VVGIRAPPPAVAKSEVGAGQTLQALPLDATLAFGASIRTLAAMIWIALHINAQVVTDHEGMRTHAFPRDTILKPPASMVTNPTVVVVSHGINALVPADPLTLWTTAVRIAATQQQGDDRSADHRPQYGYQFHRFPLSG